MRKTGFLKRLLTWGDPPGLRKTPRRPTREPGTLGGRHYTEFVDEVRALRRKGRDDLAEKLLLRLVDAVEEESRANCWPVAPWYYEQLAIIYRKWRDFEAEVRILERFASQPYSSQADPPELLQRLGKARALRERG